MVNYAFGLGLGWLLLPGDFGLIASVQSVLLVCGLVLQAGVPWALTRDIARGAETRRSALVRGAAAANLLVAFLLGLALVGLYSLGPLDAGFESVPTLIAVVLMLPSISIAAIGRAAAMGVDRFGIVAVLQLAEFGLKAAIGTVLVVLGFGVAGAIAGLLVGSVAASLLSLHFLTGPLKIAPFGPSEWPSISEAAPMLGAALGLMLILNLGLIGVKVYGAADRAQAGYYQAGVVLANAPYYLVSSAIIPVLFTRLARMRGLRETPEQVGEVLRLVLAFILPLEIGLAVAPGVALGLLFPARYGAAAASLQLLAVGNAMALLMNVLSAVFQSVRQPRLPAVVLLSAASVQAILIRAVVPDAGPVGAAAVLAIVATGGLAILGAIYVRQASLTARQSFHACLWTGRYALALGVSGAAFLVMLASGRGNWAAIMVAVLCYLVALPALRLVGYSARLRHTEG